MDKYKDKLVAITSFVIFFSFTIVELLSDVPNLSPPDKEIPEMKAGLAMANSGKDVLSISYCHSCGYYKAFMEYSQLLSNKYPDIIIEGSYYEPGWINLTISKVLGFTKIALIVLILMSKDVFGMIGMQEPRWWSWCINNRIYSCFSIFFVSNMLENMLISTGAFEITYNGIPIWSKLETGRIPGPAEIFSIIDSHKFSVQHTFADRSAYPK